MSNTHQNVQPLMATGLHTYKTLLTGTTECNTGLCSLWKRVWMAAPDERTGHLTKCFKGSVTNDDICATETALTLYANLVS